MLILSTIISLTLMILGVLIEWVEGHAEGWGEIMANAGLAMFVATLIVAFLY